MFKCLAPWNVGIKLPWEQCLGLAKDAGFEGLDCQVDAAKPASDYKDLYARFGLKPGGMCLPVDWRSDEAKFRAGLAELPKVAARAAEVGVTRFYMWILSWSDERTYAENFRFHVDRLGPCAKVLAEHGARLGLEFIGPKTFRMGHRYPFARTMEQMLDLGAAVGPNCGLLLDSWHWHTSLGTVEDIQALASDRVVYVHINDAPAGVDVDHQLDNVRRLPGATGEIDLGGFLGALRKIGYDGPVVPEPFEPRLAKLTPEKAAAETGAAMAAIWTAPASVRTPLPAKMKAVATGRKKAWLVDLPTPTPEGNQVVVKLHAAPICGSNLGAFHGDGEWVNDGHEGCGEVVAVAQSHRLRVGDRVALAPLNSCGVCPDCKRGDTIFCAHPPQVHGMFAQFTKVADNLCVPLPQDIDYVLGSMMGCCLGPAYEAIKRLGIRAYDKVVITGLGPVGLGATALAAFHGAKVIAVDSVPYRLNKARELGAEVTLSSDAGDLREQIVHHTDGEGVRRGIECSGTAAALRMHIDLATIRGQIAIIGENHAQVPICPSDDFIRKGLTLLGCWHMNVNDTPDLVQFLRRRRDVAKKLVTHTFGFAKAQEAFETFASRQAVKVVLLPWE